MPKTYAIRRYSMNHAPAWSRLWMRKWSRSVTLSGSGRSGAAWFRVRVAGALSRPAVKKPSARIPCAWDRRNSAQDGPSRRGARLIPARSPVDPGALEDPPGRGRRHRDAGPRELAVDPPVSPRLVLPGQPQHHRPHLAMRCRAPATAPARQARPPAADDVDPSDAPGPAHPFRSRASHHPGPAGDIQDTLAAAQAHAAHQAVRPASGHRRHQMVLVQFRRAALPCHCSWPGVTWPA